MRLTCIECFEKNGLFLTVNIKLSHKIHKEDSHIINGIIIIHRWNEYAYTQFMSQINNFLSFD